MALHLEGAPILRLSLIYVHLADGTYFVFLRKFGPVRRPGEFR